MAIATLSVDFLAKLANLEAGFARAEQLAGKTAAAIETSFTRAASAIQGITGALSAGAAVAWGHSIIEAGDAFNDMRQRVGMATRDLAGFKLAADSSGTSLEGVAKGIKGLGNYLTENKKAWESAGFESRTSRDALMELADVFAALPDGMEKTALAVKVFGKAGLDMIPMLNQGARGLREAQERSAEFGAAMERLAPLADRFDDQMREMSMQSKVFGMNIVTGLLPAMNELMAVMNAGAREGGFGKSFGVKAWLMGAVGDIDEAIAAAEKAAKDAQAKENGFLGALFGMRASGQQRTVEALKALKAARDEAARADFKRNEFGPTGDDMNAARAEEAARKRAAILLGGDKGLKEHEDKTADLLRELSGLSGNYNNQLDMLVAARKSGRLSTDEYADAVGRLIAKQPFAIALARDEARALEDAAKVRDKVAKADAAAGKSAADFAAAAAERVRGIKAQEDALGKSPEEQARIREFLEIDRAFDRARIHIEQTLGAIGDTDGIDRMVGQLQKAAEAAKGDLAGALDDAKRAADALNSSAEYGATRAIDTYLRGVANVADGVGGMVTRSLGAAEDAFVNFEQTGKQRVRSLVNSILSDLARLAFRQTIGKTLAGLIGGIFGGKESGGDSGGGGAGGGDTVLAALGGVFSAPSVSALSGSILTRPTLMRFAKGGAVGGEAGPEAVMPLARDSAGRLGVRAQGGGAPNVTVQIINQTGTAVDARAQGGPQFDGRQWVLGVVLEAMGTNPSFRGAMRGG